MKLDPNEYAIGGADGPITTKEQAALARRVKTWLILKLKRWVGK